MTLVAGQAGCAAGGRGRRRRPSTSQV